MSQPVIEVDHLSKRFRLSSHAETSNHLSDELLRKISYPVRWLSGRSNGDHRRDFWALQDVTFKLERGECLGIVGSNGAGKSTLLKIIARLTLPTSGTIRIRGRIGALLGVGVGFNPELTGRENVYLNGMLLGISRADINSKYNEIAEFSGIGDFLNVPVKQYSSGMRVRLGFSVIATLEPEILLLDEVLGVGDMEFRQRSMERMEQLIKGGRSVLLVSHNDRSIDQLCDWVIRLEKGALVDSGPTASVLHNYVSEKKKKALPKSGQQQIEQEDSDDRVFHFREVQILNEGNEIADTIEFSRPFRIRIRYDITSPLKSVHVLCRIETTDGVTVLSTGDSDCDYSLFRKREQGSYTADIEIPGGTLEAGDYRLTLTAGIPYQKLMDQCKGILNFGIVDETSHRRQIYIKQTRPGFFGRDIPWQYAQNPAYVLTEPTV